LAVALPGSAVTGIKDPIAFAREKVRERLFARDRGYAVTEEDDSLLLARACGREEFGYDLLFEAGSEHVGMVTGKQCSAVSTQRSASHLPQRKTRNVREPVQSASHPAAGPSASAALDVGMKNIYRVESVSGEWTSGEEGVL